MALAATSYASSAERPYFQERDAHRTDAQQLAAAAPQLTASTDPQATREQMWTLRLVDDWRGTGPAGRRLAVISGRPRQGEVVTGTVRLAREAGVDTTPVPHLGPEEICHAKSNCGISRPKRSAIASPAFCKLIIRIWPPSGNTHPLSDRGGCIDGTFCQLDDDAVHRQRLRLRYFPVKYIRQHGVGIALGRPAIAPAPSGLHHDHVFGADVH
jgi:hypothetical protein